MNDSTPNTSLTQSAGGNQKFRYLREKWDEYAPAVGVAFAVAGLLLIRSQIKRNNAMTDLLHMDLVERKEWRAERRAYMKEVQQATKK